MAIKIHRSGVLAAGLALFSMFFGAGDLIWPLILGGQAGTQTLPMMIGLLISGVSLPLLGLISMMLFKGDYYSFFKQIGRVPGMVVLFAVQMILGPLGSLPRLFTLAHATIQPYIHVSLMTFSLISAVVILLFTLKKQRIVDILGIVLTPLLLLCMGAILVLGFIGHPAPETVYITKTESFMNGLRGGYNTLDMIASFIFAPLVFSYFLRGGENDSTVEGRRHIFKKMLKSCLISGFLLATMFFGLSYLGSYYTPVLPEHTEAEKLGLIAHLLLGSKGALFSAMAITVSCLTTAIPICIISSEYIKKTFFKDRGHPLTSASIPLLLSIVIANLGFMGIAKMLEPILQILCPGLIVLCVLNILNRLCELKTPRMPVYIAFAISCIGYFVIP
ncbi:MAG: Branched-chain amino acid transport system 2 carrier protein [Chlamydiales bacterium]|nr:Branched-chain amino acid transport system 2 carrier protein [Chlamydiales bacterium]MCH9619318.1 Branched-chain amino acid transport system 2 carrier protein [Chlamydiales bacterium]MCH9622580.1 Branched-chain amino acid transport system 2 carrier protein [Chlamydiales bacterium]